jgi:putative ABC transport system permease protein
MLLLVACLNVATLQLARGASRGQELAVRVALGAGRLRLLRGPLLESALLALAGTAAGAPLAALLLRALRGLGGVQIPRLEEATVDGRALLAAVGSAALTVVVFGLLPAWQQARGAAAAARAGRATAGPRQRRLESALVIAEVGLSLVLLVGAGLLLRSLQQLFAVDPGFAARGALTFGVELPPSGGDDEARRFFDTFEEELLALPGAQAAGFVSHLPLSGAYSCDGVTAEGSPLLGDCAESRVATPGYFAAMDLRLLAGRALAAADGPDAEPAVVVNETLARRYWPEGEAVGRRLKWGDSADSGDPWRRVVGVIADVRHFGLDREVLPEVYMPHAQQPYAELEAVVRSAGEPIALVTPARHLVQRLDPRVPLREPRPLVELMAASTAARRFRAWLLAGFAAAALLLAMLGIYGVIAHLVSERRRELCLRAALGAAPAVVRRQVLATAAALAGGGIALGLLASVLVARLLERLLFGVAPLDPASFLAAPALLLAAGLLAAWLPARRAARLDPVEALRG